ncbi:tetrahydromethanopterin S-methyltransferase subunit H family protein [Methylorubrum extorquens]|uniref:CmuB n=3 Tax=Pseudomonadota TaxID=1224 RepID=A0A0U2WYZ5_ECOLX|nr:tetrahydromethanopterin S-methyltransferase subunit H [Methylorubrum extorquens]ACK86441.1 Tetrahydromethanopterin S-methyltransferase [Methylorubrum extorquens CM4]ALS39155.1 CmuB [Escherichia coli]CAB40738.1 CmuB protein [Methylorubrum extorquens CM4]
MNKYHEINLGKVSIGGPLGARTGMLVGSIFYDKHSIVSDAFAGTFDEERAAKLITRVNDTHAKYGMQMAFDVIAASGEAMDKFLRFVSARTDLPMMINATEGDARVQGLETAAELGILDRCIYASLNEDTEEFEIEALKKHKPGAVMILAYDVADPTPEGTVAMIENVFRPMLDAIGVEAPIVDCGVMDPPSIGITNRAIKLVRETYGYPAGGAVANCFPQWTGLKDLGKDFVNLSLGASLLSIRFHGGDFLHYGLVERTVPAAHAVASGEVFLGFAAQELDGHTLPRPHPVLSMFKLAVPATGPAAVAAE